ncbi:MAG: prephenate dehydratase [Candidatus Koribacter versatilis]|uniref:Prephenate dehydratase n=1 Tax=Candidatus Korobacter versatilis TaxID=658062 RepID=A0A932A8Q3_9BACT|nr:prephenate dehydratase [Candidatus Koribacter versatilis]
MKVAIQGERGAFSHEALRRTLPAAEVLACATSKDVFDAVERGRASAAVIPIENTLAGPVAEHYDLLLARRLWIQRESRLRIVHNLIAAPGVRLADVREVYSHPVALDQCRDFFRRHRRIRAVPFYDTAGAVKHVIAQERRDCAAIASRQAAREYGGEVLRAAIEDDKQNFTRFFLVSRQKRVLAGANKTSLAFAVKNVPGALFKALSVFALRDISLSRIESRPVKGRPWEYVFYADILRGRDTAAHNALSHLAEICDFVRVLGIYPAAR